MDNIEKEPAPAQDEREAVERFSPTTSVPHCGRASEVEAYMTDDDDGEYMAVAQHERIVAALTRPAQTEQQPIRLPERKRTDHLPKEYKTMSVVRAGLEAYNRALDDVAALNAAPIAQTDPWAPSGGDYDRSIHANPDAKAWADFFVKTFPGQADEHDLLLGWFANAMMAMHDRLRQGTTVHRLENDERVVTFRVNAETKDAVFDRVMKFFEEQDQFSGEGIHQSDNCLIEAPSVLSDIADKILKFNVNHKEE